MASVLKKNPSGIWYELNKNKRKGRKYDAKYANLRAYVKRKYSKKVGLTIAKNIPLKKRVEELLLDDQSPEHISERIRRHEKNLEQISGIAIRRYISSVYGRKIEAHRAKILKRRRRRMPRVYLQGKRMISKRPKIINARKRIGDAEGDFILSGRSGKGMIFNVTDRKSRNPFLEKILPISIRTIENALKRIKKRFPELKTLTFDNDILFVHHKELEKKFDVKIYFCFPGHPWEKGSNENRNKIIRQYIPKGSDISRFSRRYIQRLEEKLQKRIMKCLNYLTPKEVLEKHRKRKKKPQSLPFKKNSSTKYF
jgi:IS30 family transposase